MLVIIVFVKLCDDCHLSRYIIVFNVVRNTIWLRLRAYLTAILCNIKDRGAARIIPSNVVWNPADDWCSWNNVNDVKLIIHVQEKRLAQEIADLEKDTGFKLRVLAQNYPDTPGLWSRSSHSLRVKLRLLINEMKPEINVL